MEASTSLLDQLGAIFRQCDVVELSPLLENGIPKAPTHPPMIIHPTVTHEHDGYFCQTIFLPEHIGSHVDVPAHVNAHMMDYTLDTYGPDMIVGPAVVLDMAPLDLKPGELLSAAQVLQWEERTGVRIGAGDIVLVNFDWMRRYWRADGESHWYVRNSPGMDESVCRLLWERKVKAVGTDTFACEIGVLDGVETSMWGHKKYWLPNEIFEIECLANLERLPPRCFFIGMPLRIKGGSGSPIRAMALVPREGG